MTTRKIINCLKKHQPETVREVLIDCKLPLQFLGEGAYREAYQIVGTNLVIKLPIHNGDLSLADCLEHSADERSHLEAIRGDNKLKPLWPYLATFHYFNPDTGVVLVEKYDPVPAKKYRSQMNMIEGMFYDLMPGGDSDLHYDNFGLDAKGNLKVIDCGRF